MEIKDVLRKEVVKLHLNARTKESVISELVEVLVAQGVIKAEDKERFEAVIWEREGVSSTGVGDGIAIPHGMSEYVQKPTVVFGRSDKGIDFESLDDQPAYLFFLIATPKSSNSEHLSILASLSTKLLKESVRQALLKAKDAEDVIAAFDEEDAPVEALKSSKGYLVAVTACATGIAHTYMAAEKLQEAARQKGYDIKVETNGSSGVDNALSAGDIQKAAGVIVAADIQVQMNRFDGKMLVHVPVSQAISKPESLIDQVLEKTSAYHAHASRDESESAPGKGVYQHLLNGVSHMLPFVVAGGIMIAIGFLIDQILGVPTESLGSLGSYHEVSKIFNDIGGVAFGFMLPVLAGYIAMSIADRPGLIVGFVAGGLASAGGSGFLGALLGGFLGGYIANGIKALLKNLPESLSGIRSVLLYPLLGVLVGGLLMLLINVPMSHLNTLMNDFLNSLSGTNAILLGLILGAMMAIDLGGPINKAAYVFGTGTLAATASTGGSAVMAAVMAAGMVPPLAIFIATLMFKNRFTNDQRQAGVTNLILGASFITEGAIPFASADPLPMLTSFIIGSAVSSALVLGFGIKVLAPHGGIFVIMLVSNPLLYILFIVIGSVVSALLIGVLKKPLKA